MRILHVISSMDSRGGGPAIAMAGLAKAQHAAGLEIAALATWIKGSTQDIAETLGVDLREFQMLPPPGSFRGRFPAIGDRKIILFLGRLHPGKGMEYLIPALARLQRDDALLAAVGPDSQGFQSTLERLAR